VIQANGSGNDGIGGGQHPAQDGNKVHPIKYQSIPDGQPFVLTDVRDGGGLGQIVSLTAIVEHGKPIIIAFYKSRNNGCDPAYQGYKGEDKNGYGVYCLPKAVADGQPDASAHVVQHRLCLKTVFLAIDQRLCPLAEIGKDGGADDEEQIFEQGKIKEQEHEPYHHLPHHEQEGKASALLMMEPSSDAGELPQPGDGGAGGFQEKIHAYTKEEGIEYPGDKDPFPQFVLGDKVMGLGVGLESYDYFLKQNEKLLYF